MTDYLNELNESQRAAVLYNDGPSLVIAGAGSGKTRVLTYKIAYLLDNGYEPWSILALTFTNKAAREMKERIARRVGAERARYLWMGTFHSIFSRILRTEAAAIGFSANFTIYDAADSKSLCFCCVPRRKRKALALYSGEEIIMGYLIPIPCQSKEETDEQTAYAVIENAAIRNTLAARS